MYVLWPWNFVHIHAKIFEEKALDPSFCLDKETLILKKEHPYFYQVQLQMLLTTTNYCDHVLWRQGSILQQQIFFDDTFLKPVLDHVELSFKSVYSQN